MKAEEEDLVLVEGAMMAVEVEVEVEAGVAVGSLQTKPNYHLPVSAGRE